MRGSSLPQSLFLSFTQTIAGSVRAVYFLNEAVKLKALRVSDSRIEARLPKKFLKDKANFLQPG